MLLTLDVKSRLPTLNHICDTTVKIGWIFPILVKSCRSRTVRNSSLSKKGCSPPEIIIVT